MIMVTTPTATHRTSLAAFLKLAALFGKIDENAIRETLRKTGRCTGRTSGTAWTITPDTA